MSKTRSKSRTARNALKKGRLTWSHDADQVFVLEPTGAFICVPEDLGRPVQSEQWYAQLLDDGHGSLTHSKSCSRG